MPALSIMKFEPVVARISWLNSKWFHALLKLYKTTFALNSLLNFLLDVDIKFLFKEENTILS
jgi:hypothetical protein